MTTPLVKFENVDVALNGKLILRGVSWQLLPGQHWAILGANGSGKSTLLRLIRGELSPIPGRGSRVYALDGVEQSTAVGVQEAIACVSPEMQQRYLQQEWSLTARQVIESGFCGGDYAYRRLTSAQKKRALTLARRLAVETLLRRNVQELSTGELRRVLIARALASKPRALVCDEICDGVDAGARGCLLETLDHVARNGTQLLFVSHRADELVEAITHRLVMDRGQIVECGSMEKPGAEARNGVPFQEAKRLLSPSLSSTPSGGEGARRAGEEALRFMGRKQIQKEQGAALATHRPTSPPRRGPGPSRPLIRIRNASVFLGTRRVLHNINWEMRAGEHWAILGPNGAGKSTFLKLVLGDLHPAWGGQVTRFEFTSRHTLWQVKRRIGFVSPELQANYRDDVTGADVIGSGFFSSIGRTQTLSAIQRRRVALIVRQFGLETIAKKRALELSYGEFRKLLLARALVHEPELLIFDEPFDGLDTLSRGGMAATLAEVAARGVSLLLVTHHAGDLPACTTHLARLKEGRVGFQGPAAKA